MTKKTINKKDLVLPTFERVEELMRQDGYDGLCVACGSEQGGCDPDTTDCKCDSCGEFQVHGALHLLTAGLYTMDEAEPDKPKTEADRDYLAIFHGNLGCGKELTKEEVFRNHFHPSDRCFEGVSYFFESGWTVSRFALVKPVGFVVDRKLSYAESKVFKASYPSRTALQRREVVKATLNLETLSCRVRDTKAATEHVVFNVDSEGPSVRINQEIFWFVLKEIRRLYGEGVKLAYHANPDKAMVYVRRDAAGPYDWVAVLIGLDPDL